jgi:hypothetical protein
MAAEDVRAVLGLSETGPSGEFYDFPIAGVTLANGWYLITATRCDHAIRSEAILPELSSTASVIACSIEEHVMFMSSALWRRGQEIWSVQHRGGDYGNTDLVIKGLPPDNFEDLRAHCFAAQESARDDSIGVDYVADIPMLLAKSIVGFKYDEINPETEARFRALRQEPTGLLARAMRSRWKFW